MGSDCSAGRPFAQPRWVGGVVFQAHVKYDIDMSEGIEAWTSGKPSKEKLCMAQGRYFSGACNVRHWPHQYSTNFPSFGVMQLSSLETITPLSH